MTYPLSGEVHRHTVDRELVAAGFTPGEREAFFQAWAIDLADLTEAEAVLLFRHLNWQATPRPEVRDG